jgi:hypothetical protein
MPRNHQVVILLDEHKGVKALYDNKFPIFYRGKGSYLVSNSCIKMFDKEEIPYKLVSKNRKSQAKYNAKRKNIS